MSWYWAAPFHETCRIAAASAEFADGEGSRASGRTRGYLCDGRVRDLLPLIAAAGERRGRAGSIWFHRLAHRPDQQVGRRPGMVLVAYRNIGKCAANSGAMT
jgi:hypothetical protein